MENLRIVVSNDNKPWPEGQAGLPVLLHCDHPCRDVPSIAALRFEYAGDSQMKIALASDHAGYAEKERLKPLLQDLGVEVDDLGTVSEESVDYPDYARKVAEQVAGGYVDQGLLVCGSGTGMAITANKVPGVRAAVAWSEETARLARQHNDANVLAIGARTTPPGQIPAIVRAWFAADFEGGRHAGRVEKIRRIESATEALRHGGGALSSKQ
jgi:ribose 5-phosphate isomerase B